MKTTTAFVKTAKKLLPLFLIMALAACTNIGKDVLYKQVSIINGQVDHCDSCNVKLEYYDHAQLKDVDIMSITVRKGRFAFKVAEDTLPGPGVYTITLVLNESNPYRDNRFKDIPSHIYLPADTISMTIDPDGTPGSKVYPYPKSSSGLSYTDIRSTAPIQKQLNFYYQQRDSMDLKFRIYEDSRKALFSQAIEEGNKKEMDRWADTLNNFFATGGLYRPKAADAFIRKYPGSELVPFVMLENQKQMSAAPRFRKYYLSMSPEQKNTYYGKVLDKRLARWEKKNTAYAKYIIGAEITYLAGKTPDGRKLDAEKIFRKNKLTLVDFWASWCDSCRLRSPAYRKLYGSYKGKGFEIIGVSLDVNVGTWQRAIQEDKLGWYQLSDLKENHGDILRFRLKSIPANIVMNQEGKIVAANVSPKELESLLLEKL